MRAKALVISMLILGSATVAGAQDLLPRDNGIFTYHRSPRWRESESHPIRIAGYLLHPIGWVFREAVFRPFSAFAGSTEFTKSFLGFREPFDYREPICFNDTSIPDCHSVPPFLGTIDKKKPEGAEVGGPGSMVSERQVYFPDINFDFDKSTLNQLGQGRVRQVAQLLASVPSLKVVVEGHTDYKGTDEYNMKLGQRRAEAVMKELTEMGVDAARMSPISYGEGKPIFTEETDWARAINRRVQFSVAGEGTPAPAAAPAAEQAKSSESLPPAAGK